MESLASAFTAAGAKNVIATLWPMSDQAGLVFTESFYGELLGAQQCSPLEAARRAQLLTKEYRGMDHPFFWAPFVVFGSASWEDQR